MIPRADNTGLRPVASVESTRAIAPIGDTRQDSNERLVRLEVGKQFQAQILSRFNDGTFLVRIADTAARIALPAGGKIGDGLALTLLTTDPRPTFSLDSHSGGAIVVTASGVGADSVGQTLRTAGAQLAQALYQTNAGDQSGERAHHRHFLARDAAQIARHGIRLQPRVRALFVTGCCSLDSL